jgi:hypothetical protein
MITGEVQLPGQCSCTARHFQYSAGLPLRYLPHDGRHVREKFRGYDVSIVFRAVGRIPEVPPSALFHIARAIDLLRSSLHNHLVHTESVLRAAGREPVSGFAVIDVSISGFGDHRSLAPALTRLLLDENKALQEGEAENRLVL